MNEKNQSLFTYKSYQIRCQKRKHIYEYIDEHTKYGLPF
jgi:hypothetical protein